MFPNLHAANRSGEDGMMDIFSPAERQLLEKLAEAGKPTD